MKHYHGHQQALIKDDICIVALSFSEHNEKHFVEVFKNFDYDYVVDMCSIVPSPEQDPIVGAYWNGSQFIWNPYPSWSYNKTTKKLEPPFKPPFYLKPEDKAIWGWDEENKTWYVSEEPGTGTLILNHEGGNN